MSLSLDHTLHYLNDCGCCAGLSVAVPTEVYNRPGLDAIAYRVGTHAQFKDSLLARLSNSDWSALRHLKTREDDDFTIALLDAWAVVADVLTFYQERIANESYLRTATERRSLLELARLIGYELRPGVAAGTYLAFTLEDASGALSQALKIVSTSTAKPEPEPPPPVTLATGIKVQSVPGPDEKAQTFETVEQIEARAEWNEIKPRPTWRQQLAIDMGCVILKGTTSHIKPGDVLMIAVSATKQTPRRVFKVTTDEDAKITRLDLVSPPADLPPYERPASPVWGKLSDFPQKTALDDIAVQNIVSKNWREEDLSALVKIQGWSVPKLVASLSKQKEDDELAADMGVFVFRQRAAVFGYNAGKLVSYTNRFPDPQDKWSDWMLDEEDGVLFLDNAYDEIVPQSYLALTHPDKPLAKAQIFWINDVNLGARTAYGMSSKTTQLDLLPAQKWWPSTAVKSLAVRGLRANIPNQNQTEGDSLSAIRDLTAYVQSEKLELAEEPIEDVVKGDTVTLDRAYLGLKVGQRVILTGTRDDLKGASVSEVRSLKQVIVEAGFTVVTFDRALDHAYLRRTVTINANVARATHGETVVEVLGSGDTGQPFQRFTLRQEPLTYISSGAASGAETTFKIWVNDLRWREVPTFYGRKPDDRIYVTRTGDDGKTTVIFGDGKTGARLPSGTENVRAEFRKGIGLSGCLKPGQLSQLMTRPWGVKAVTNPLVTSGAADRESRAEARRNAPLTVLTLDRIVSLQDYEDFARAFAGIDKAMATWAWVGQKRRVFITVAGAQGAAVTGDSDLYKNLKKAIGQSGDPTIPVSVASYVQCLFRLHAVVQVHPDHIPEKVLAAVEQELRECFSFAAREFGQPVTLSEVVAVLQDVQGVVAVNVKKLYRAEEDPQQKKRLNAALPRPGRDRVFAAELLTLDPQPITLEAMS